MTFLEPGRLLLLLGVAALAVVYVVMQRRRKRYAVRFAALPLLDRVAPKGPGWRRHLPAAAYLLMGAALVTAFARPEAETKVPREEATVVVALDVSNSMMATDVTPDRITVAKAAAGSFVEQLPDPLRVGLVTFASSAQVPVPPTTDHQQVEQAIHEVALRGGTAIGDALIAAVQSVRAASTDAAVPARIVLLSDGANVAGSPVSDGIQAATEAGIPVSTIAYGSEDGSVTINGRTIPVPADAETLAQVAEQTGGKAYQAASAAELNEVYEDLSSSIGFRLERTEVTSWFVGAALALALLAAAGSLVWFSRLP
ncbi:MAG TPA: VWA domain-containing protein [Dermatophilaceae bacterium]|nr:VWA domain-containing protein [Dermatophilaceae bacterium]